jgi:hydrogenase 3 maturation protease
LSCLANDLRAILSRPTAIVGVGNRLCNDDAVGVLIADRLTETIAGDAACTVVVAEDVIENHVFPIADGLCTNVLIIDAVSSPGSESGSLVLGRIEDLECGGGYSTHKMALSTAASILRHHGKDVYLLGIVAANTDYGSDVSREIADAAQAVVAMISSQLPAQLAAGSTE